MSVLAHVPEEPVAVPPAVSKALDELGLSDATTRAVWLNGVGGLTFSITRAGSESIEFYAKHNPPGSSESLTEEAERLRWIAGKHPAPEVVALANYDGHEVLVTRALQGESAVSDRSKALTSQTLRALGTGLRQLHELPVADCPYDWGTAHRLRAGGITREKLEQLGEAPSIDRLVVCQGDPCAPNTLIAEGGSFLAHVDLARLGVADRWADLAVMSLPLPWNYTDYDEADFWGAYGLEPDNQRIAYYRALWNAE